jgi:hypothetical protein
MVKPSLAANLSVFADSPTSADSRSGPEDDRTRKCTPCPVEEHELHRFPAQKKKKHRFDASGRTSLLSQKQTNVSRVDFLSLRNGLFERTFFGQLLDETLTTPRAAVIRGQARRISRASPTNQCERSSQEERVRTTLQAVSMKSSTLFHPGNCLDSIQRKAERCSRPKLSRSRAALATDWDCS